MKRVHKKIVCMLLVLLVVLSQSALVAGAYESDVVFGQSGNGHNSGADKIILGESSITLGISNTYQLTYELVPDDVQPIAVEWLSSNSEIATVEDGLVTAVSPGTADITVRSAENETIAAVCAVEVVPLQMMTASAHTGKFLAKIDPPAEGSIPVSNRAQLEAIKDNLSGKYHLTADIDLSDAEWVPIGTISHPFTGVFDGQGHIISNLKITGDYTYSGLFGYSNNAFIKNIGLENTEININATTGVYVGGICGYYNFSSGAGSISNSFHSGSITASSADGTSTNAGGICGNFHSSYSGTIENCYNTGALTAYATGPEILFGGGSANIGGICGRFAPSVLASDPGSVSNCYNTGDVYTSSKSSMAGGIIGQNFSQNTAVSYCYNAGAITAVTTSVAPSGDENVAGYQSYAGGICGYAAFSITDCFNTGDVFSSCINSHAYAAGIATTHTTINNCYNTGSISASTSNVTYTGGIYSYRETGQPVNNCYSLNPYGNSDVTQLSSSQMKAAENFVGFDFDNIWAISASRNNGYPFLRALSGYGPGGGDGGETAPTITTVSVPGAVVGQNYTAVLEATGTTPITWSITSGTLPDGLTLAGNAISGTPTATGNYDFRVQAANSKGSASTLLSITVTENGGGGSATLSYLKDVKFPNGMYWNRVGKTDDTLADRKAYANSYTVNSPCPAGHSHPTSCNAFYVGDNPYAAQCLGFTYKLEYDLYGGNPTEWCQITDLDKVKPGDHIRWFSRKDSNGKDIFHSVFVLNVEGDTIIYADCNGRGSSMRCIIQWGGSKTKDQITGYGLTYIKTAPYAADQVYGMPGKTVRISCPVDLEIYDEDGTVVGRVIDNVVDNTVPLITAIAVSVDGDDKLVTLPSIGRYSFKVIGTDDGTMDIAITDVDLGSFDTGDSKVFTNIALHNGKEFATTISADMDPSDVTLYVMDGDDVVAEIGTDGTETPVGNGGGNNGGSTGGSTGSGNSDSYSGTSYSNRTGAPSVSFTGAPVGPIQVGDSFKLVPNPYATAGSSGWTWDEAYFSATFNPPATFTALKPGTTTITYATWTGISGSVEVTILPNTQTETAAATGSHDPNAIGPNNNPSTGTAVRPASAILTAILSLAVLAVMTGRKTE